MHTLTHPSRPEPQQSVVKYSATLASAEQPELNAGDMAWMLTSTALVLLMTPGLAFFYGGMVRAKNVISTLLQSFMAMGLITMVWTIVGYVRLSGCTCMYAHTRPGPFPAIPSNQLTRDPPQPRTPTPTASRWPSATR